MKELTMYTLTEYCNKRFKGLPYGKFNCLAHEYTKELIEESNMTIDFATHFCNVMLYDQPFGDDAFVEIWNVMQTLHYDNGEPLCEDGGNNYFEHYDRTDDYNSYFDNQIVEDFITNGETMFVRLRYTCYELHEDLRNDYDGASYEHDYPKLN